MHLRAMGCPTVRGCIVRYPNVTPPYYGALFVGDGVSLPTPPQFGCDECILTRVTSYQNRKGGKRWAKQLGSSWYLTPLLWDTPYSRVGSRVPELERIFRAPVVILGRVLHTREVCFERNLGRIAPVVPCDSVRC